MKIVTAILLPLLFASSANAFVIRARYDSVDCAGGLAGSEALLTVMVDGKDVASALSGMFGQQGINAVLAFCDGIKHLANASAMGQNSSITPTILIETTGSLSKGTLMTNESAQSCNK